MEIVLYLIFVVVPLTIALVVGKILEQNHYKSIRQREKEWLRIPAVTLDKTYVHPRKIAKTELAIGSVVVSIDHFKRFLSVFRQIFGGEMHSYSSVIDRARREALLRMKESHPHADAFVNCRLETSSISKGEQDRIGCSELLAYSTAIYYE